MTHCSSPAKQHTDEELFKAIKASVDALPPGAKMVLNSCQCLHCCTIMCIELTALLPYYSAILWAADGPPR